MSAGSQRTCEGCGRAVPAGDFSCAGCGKFYAGSFEAPPATAPTTMVRAVRAPDGPPGAIGVPPPKTPASGLRGLAIVAALVFGVIGVGCVSIVAVTVLGKNARTEFVPVDGQFGGGGGSGGGYVSIGPGSGVTGVGRPIMEAKLACGHPRGTGGIEGNGTSDQVGPKGRDQYALLVQTEGNGEAVWLAGVDLESGAVVADPEGGWDDDMERHSTVVVCASELQPVTAERIDCVYMDATVEGSAQTVTQQWMPTIRTIEVFALGTGDLLGIGALYSAPPVCPATQAPEALALMLPEPGALERWATEHISNGEVS